MEITERVFSNLEKRNDLGIGQFRSMLKRLTEWDYFDPYYFKKINKLYEAEAKRNIMHSACQGRDARLLSMCIGTAFIKETDMETAGRIPGRSLSSPGTRCKGCFSPL